MGRGETLWVLSASLRDFYRGQYVCECYGLLHSLINDRQKARSVVRVPL